MAGPRAADGAVTLNEWKVAVNAEVPDGRKGVLVCFGGRGEEIVIPHGKKNKIYISQNIKQVLGLGELL
jgi:hypothetical protein